MSASIAILPSYQFFKATGQPAANCNLHTYLANTLTDVTTWLDKDQITENSNPILLDSDGRCTLWVEPGIYIDLVLKDELDVAEIDTFEDITGATSTVLQESEWVVTGLDATYVSATSFTLPGNQTSTFKVGRWVRAVEGASYKYGVIISSTFTSSTAVTIATDSSTLTPSLTTVDIGQLSPSPASGLYGSGNKVSLTGYTGANITLQPGQYASYTISGVTSLNPRITTGNNQKYTIDLIIDKDIVGTIATPNNILANGAVLGAANISYVQNSVINGVNAAGQGTLTSFPMDDGNRNFYNKVELYTATKAKTVVALFFSLKDTGITDSGLITSTWSDTTTALTSFTLAFNRSLSGTVTIRREY